jgi:anaphase-promoting complex subunit 11
MGNSGNLNGKVLLPQSKSYVNVSRLEMCESKNRVRIVSWKPVATWTWGLQNEEVCGICHNAFEMAAPGQKWPGDDSPIAFGHCGHAFHIQCIMKWIAQPQSKNTCPICRRYFEFQSGDH